MKLFLGYIFALIFAISSSVTDYSKNQLGFQGDNDAQFGYSSDDFDVTFTPYQNHVHHGLCLDIEEKNEKFKKTFSSKSTNVVKFNSFPKKVNKFDSFYLSKFIVPSVSKNILLETFRI